MISPFKSFFVKRRNRKKLQNQKKNIENICREYNILNYSINDDLSVDVDGHVLLQDSRLLRIPLKFRKVIGSFFVHRNNLISLEGSPEYIGGTFLCGENQLTSLKFGPKYVEVTYNCRDNNLTSLEGAPERVREFICTNNNLKSLKYFPDVIGGHVFENPVSEILALFSYNVKCIEWLNEYDVIQGDDVILSRLHDVFDAMNMRIPNEIELKNYNIIE